MKIEFTFQGRHIVIESNALARPSILAPFNQSRSIVAYEWKGGLLTSCGYTSRMDAYRPALFADVIGRFGVFRVYSCRGEESAVCPFDEAERIEVAWASLDDYRDMGPSADIWHYIGDFEDTQDTQDTSPSILARPSDAAVVLAEGSWAPHSCSRCAFLVNIPASTGAFGDTSPADRSCRKGLWHDSEPNISFCVHFTPPFGAPADDLPF